MAQWLVVLRGFARLRLCYTMCGKVIFLVAMLVLVVCEASRPCAKKYQRIKNHSACALRSIKATDSGVSPDEKEYIVKEHMRIRREVDPPAMNMREITWDDELANTAQGWADTCNIRHDIYYQRMEPGRFSVGQNLASHLSSKDWKIAVHGWESEKKNFTYAAERPKKAVVKSYTQVVWADTSKIGCGYANCGDRHNFVCNYAPSGNIRNSIMTPWKNGDTCDDCQGRCNKKICDCKGKTCLNDGISNLETCGCTCVNSIYGGPLPFYTGDTCALNCTDIEEPPYCNTLFNVKSCSIMADMKIHCPKMCGICDI